MDLRPWTLPNLLTVGRLAALPFLIIAILEGRHGTALLIFLVAAVSDIVDGFLARRFGMGSRMGAYLDPIADKLFLVSSFVVFALPATPSRLHIPIWLLAVTISRDISILAMCGVGFFAFGIRSFPPSILGKATTFFEISTVVALLLVNVSRMPEIVARVCFQLVAAFAAASGLHYVWRASQSLSIRARGGMDDPHGSGGTAAP
jgi:cardiolipin synthase